MKKLVTVAVIMAMLVATVALLAGCGGGGDTEKAKQYMKAGDQLMKQVETEGNQTSATVQQAFADLTDPASSSSAVQQVKTATANVTGTANKAKAEFEKINSLNDVADYKKYADLEISSINTVVEINDEVNKFVDQAVGIMSSPSGTTEQLTAAQTAFTTQVDDLSAKITKAQTEANNLKKGKNL